MKPEEEGLAEAEEQAYAEEVSVVERPPKFRAMFFNGDNIDQVRKFLGCESYSVYPHTEQLPIYGVELWKYSEDGNKEKKTVRLGYPQWIVALSDHVTYDSVELYRPECFLEKYSIVP